MHGIVRVGVSVIVVTSLSIFTETIMHLVQFPPPLPPQKNAYPLFPISPGYYRRPKRNRRQCICKLLEVNKVDYGIVQNGQFVCLRSVFGLNVMHWVIHFARFKDNSLTPYNGEWLRIFFKLVREKMNDLKAKWKTWNSRLTSQWPFGRKSGG